MTDTIPSTFYGQCFHFGSRLCGRAADTASGMYLGLILVVWRYGTQLCLIHHPKQITADTHALNSVFSQNWLAWMDVALAYLCAGQFRHLEGLIG